jgi:hypothetical protein
MNFDKTIMTLIRVMQVSGCIFTAALILVVCKVSWASVFVILSGVVLLSAMLIFNILIITHRKEAKNKYINFNKLRVLEKADRISPAESSNISSIETIQKLHDIADKIKR